MRNKMGKNNYIIFGYIYTKMVLKNHGCSASWTWTFRFFIQKKMPFVTKKDTFTALNSLILAEYFGYMWYVCWLALDVPFKFWFNINWNRIQKAVHRWAQHNFWPKFVSQQKIVSLETLRCNYSKCQPTIAVALLVDWSSSRKVWKLLSSLG